MNQNETTRKVDLSALRVNQAFIIIFLILAFVLDSWQLVAFVGLVMLIGTALPRLSLFKQIYRRALQPAGFVKPDVIADNPEPHRFAQGFGGVVLALAVISFLAGQAIVGWVTGLAGHNPGRFKLVPGFLRWLFPLLSTKPAACARLRA